MFMYSYYVYIFLFLYLCIIMFTCSYCYVCTVLCMLFHCDVLCTVCVCVCVCKCVLYCCHRVSTQLQLTNISVSIHVFRWTCTRLVLCTLRHDNAVAYRGGGWRSIRPWNSEGPPKSCKTQPDCENCYKLLNFGLQHPKMFGKKAVKL